MRECCEETTIKTIMEKFETIVNNIKQKGLADINKNDTNQVSFTIYLIINPFYKFLKLRLSHAFFLFS